MKYSNDGICISMIHNKNIRCKNKVQKGYDYCRVHQKNSNNPNKEKCNIIQPILLTNNDELCYSEIINDDILKQIEVEYIIDDFIDKILNNVKEHIEKHSEILDNNYLYNLFGIEDSWKNVPYIYWINVNNMWWDIRTLTQTIATQLNQSELEHPYPIYPENPFNRNKFTVDDLIKIQNHIQDIQKYAPSYKFHINIALEEFLNFSPKVIKKIYSIKKQYNVAMNIINNFSNKLRFKMINYKNSQGKYCGYWVTKNTQLSKFEKCYDKIIQVNIIISNGREFGNITMRNLINIINCINNLKPEEYIL
jgi:hypothetical protein